MAAYDDLDVKRIFGVGIGSVVVTAVTALAVQTLYAWMVQKQEIATAAKSEYRRQNKILADQAESISKFGVDPVTANYVIPIDEAIALVATSNDSHEGDDGHHGKSHEGHGEPHHPKGKHHSKDNDESKHNET